MSTGFNTFGFRPEIRRALDDAGYETPTPIQAEAIPILLEGGDLIGVAETGTGKTLAFCLPMFQKMQAGESDPQGMVICPTRELAIQVAGEAERFGHHLGLRIVLAYGGTSSGEQKAKLAAGCDLVVGTPGRLLDFVNSAWLSLRKLRTLVLDEADRMLDMGFINDVDAILRRSPMSRQTMLFSATFPPQIQDMADRFLLHPEIVRMHTGTQVTKNVDHVFFEVNQAQKDALLREILRREKPEKTLVFTATREGTSEVALFLRRDRHDVISLSSLLSQANRERALKAFRAGECDVLVATDVASRGLDIDDIDLVVNYDVPMHPEDYVHRIGRTGRAAKLGKAVTLVSELDRRRAAEIDNLLPEPVKRVTLEGFPYRTPASAHHASGSSRNRGPRPAGRGRPQGGNRGGAGKGGASRKRPRGKSGTKPGGGGSTK
jgi:ATP-dependent RNA helicase RhlE